MATVRKPHSLDDRRTNVKPHDGSVLDVHDRVRFCLFVKYIAKVIAMD